MASVAEFIPDPIDLEEDIKRRDDLAESTRREKYIAARKIQVNDACLSITWKRVEIKKKKERNCAEISCG